MIEKVHVTTLVLMSTHLHGLLYIPTSLGTQCRFNKGHVFNGLRCDKEKHTYKEQSTIKPYSQHKFAKDIHWHFKQESLQGSRM